MEFLLRHIRSNFDFLSDLERVSLIISYISGSEVSDFSPLSKHEQSFIADFIRVSRIVFCPNLHGNNTISHANRPRKAMIRILQPINLTAANAWILKRIRYLGLNICAFVAPLVGTRSIFKYLRVGRPKLRQRQIWSHAANAVVINV